VVDDAREVPREPVMPPLAIIPATSLGSEPGQLPSGAPCVTIQLRNAVFLIQMPLDLDQAAGFVEGLKRQMLEARANLDGPKSLYTPPERKHLVVPEGTLEG
jgi:hypothetical protein